MEEYGKKIVSPGMKLYRYMSIVEFIKMNAGMNMIPKHTEFVTKRTNSLGFCFLGENTLIECSDGVCETFSPQDCILFLNGIVNDEILVEFIATDKIELAKRLWNICRSIWGL